MMRRFLTPLLGLVLLAMPLAAAPPERVPLPRAEMPPPPAPPPPAPAPEPVLAVPGAISGRVGQLLVVRASGADKVHWLIPTNLRAEDRSYIDSSTRTLLLIPAEPGLYRVDAVSIGKGGISVGECMVTVRGDKPEGWEADLATAYRADADAKLAAAEDLTRLASLYRATGSAVEAGLVRDAAGLAATLRAAEPFLLRGRIPRTAGECRAHLLDVLDGRPFSGARDALGTIADALGRVGPSPPPGPGPRPPPGPGPQPPGPGPGPAPGPVPPADFRVLMLYHAADLGKLPPAQLAVLYSQQIRDYLSAKCPPGPDGKTREWRVWPDTVDPSGESAWLQAAAKRPHASLPWIEIGDPAHGGYEGPLPESVDKALELLKKFGGN